MKKFWEKHDLFKIAGLMALFTVVLTWLIPQGYFQSELEITEITRIGIFDFFTYGLLGMYYFTVLVTFLFVLGGFYQVLAKASGYQKLTDSIAKFFKGKEIVFVLVLSFIFAILSAMMNEYFVLIAFIPFFVTIMSKMKLDKITGFVTTFGAILIGIIGSIYGSKVAGVNVSQLGTDYNTYMWVKLVLFAISFIALNTFNILNIIKVSKAKKDEEIKDLFISEESSKKTKVWPVAIVLGLFALVSLLAYIPWETAFGVSFFADITTNILEYEVLGAPIFSYLLGSVSAFGDWDIFGVQILMLMTALLIKWIYGIKNQEFVTAFGEGFIKTGKLVILLLAAYVTLEFTVMYPIIPTIVDWIMHLTSKFNVFFGTISGIVASLFTVEYQYTVNLIGSYLMTTYSAVSNQVTIMLQATFGLTAFFAPTSVILLIGLSYLDINYKEWFKFIWKFLIIMFIAIVILLLIIC